MKKRKPKARKRTRYQVDRDLKKARLFPKGQQKLDEVIEDA